MHLRTMRMVVVALAFAGAAGIAFGYNANYWQPVNGEWNGKWSDTRHWGLGHVPNGDDAIFLNTTGEEIVVEVDKDFTQGDDMAIPSFIKFGYSTDEKGPYAAVRLVGSGKLTQSATSSIYSYPNTHAIIDDNVTIEWTRGWGVHSNCTVEVRGNAVVNLNNTSFGGEHHCRYVIDGGSVTASTINLKEGSSLKVKSGSLTLGTGSSLTVNTTEPVEISGGTVDIQNVALREDAVFTVSGGTVSLGYFTGDNGLKRTVTFAGGTVTMSGTLHTTYFSSDDDFRFTGGTFHHKNQTSMIGVLPSDPNSTYYHDILIGNSENFPNDFCRPLRGHYMQTNNTAWLRFNMAEGIAYGGGVLDISLPYIANNSKITLDLSRFALDYWQNYSYGSVLYFPRDIIYGCFGAYTRSSMDGSVKVPGKITYETTDRFDAAKSHSLQSGNLLWTPGMEMAVTGAGTLDFKWGETAPFNYPTMAALTLGDGVTLSRTDEKQGGGDNTCAQRYGRVTLGAGATYRDSRYHAVEATELAVGSGAKLIVNVQGLSFSETTSIGGGWSSRPLLLSAKATGVSTENFELLNIPSGMDLAIVQAGPNFALRDRNFVSPVEFPVFDYSWTNTTGATASRLDAKENYYRANGAEQAVPTKDTSIFFGPIDVAKSHEVIVPSGGMTVNRLSFGGCDGKNWRRASDPYYFTGGKLTVAKSSTVGYTTTIYDCTPNPVVFDCDVEGSGATFGVAPYTFAAFNGAFSAKKLSMVGTLVFGGTATISGGIVPYAEASGSYTYAGSRASAITVLDGGSLTVGNQTAFAAPFALLVEENGSATVDGVWSCGRDWFNHIVNGTLTLNAPLTASAEATALFTGTGTVNLSSLAPAAVSTGTVEIARSLRINAGALNTAAADGSMKIKVQSFQKPTLGATADWTYGPAVATTTESANRALTLDVGAELTIDTTDPSSPTVGHNVTIADPVKAEKVAKLVKTGKGRLTLASAENTFGDVAGVDVRAGSFAWTAAQTMGSFTAAAGTELVYAKVGGEIPVLTVDADVDLDGVLIDPDGTETRNFASQPRAVIAVTAGHKLTGTPTCKYRTKFAVSTDPVTGATSLSVRMGQGLVMVIR